MTLTVHGSETHTNTVITVVPPSSQYTINMKGNEHEVPRITLENLWTPCEECTQRTSVYNSSAFKIFPISEGTTERVLQRVRSIFASCPLLKMCRGSPEETTV